MPTLRQLRRRRVSVENIQQVTQAMKMVAAAKLRRAQADILSARPYARRLDALLGHLVSRIRGAERASAGQTEDVSDSHPLLVQREPERIGLVAVTSDRGLCGSFNSNLIRSATARLARGGSAEVHLICVGKKGWDFFRRREYPILGEQIDFFNELAFPHARRIVEMVLQHYTEMPLDRVDIIYNEFQSVIQQNVMVEQFLPILPDEPEGDPFFIDYLYEPSREKILDAMLPKHLEVQMWRILLESHAAEHAARMTAMDAATDNARELIEQLTLDINRARQTAITKEITEIVGGAEALKG